MPLIITPQMERIASAMKKQARRGGLYLATDAMNPGHADYVSKCRRSHVDRVNRVVHTMMFTRDVGHHTSGWWKNPDYERCFHLSLSFVDTESLERSPQRHDLAKLWCDLFFTDYTRLLWVEPPYSAEGKLADVYHYRLFCDPSWTPILPRGEVYTKEFTDAGWKSWSDVHGDDVRLGGADG